MTLILSQWHTKDFLLKKVENNEEIVPKETCLKEKGNNEKVQISSNNLFIKALDYGTKKKK